MPLIRYDIGDYGHPVEGVCRCGNQSPLLSVDLGKIQHVYELPGGKRVHTTVFTKPLYRLPSVRSYQVRCSKNGKVEFLVVPQDPRRYDVRADAEKAAAECVERLGPSVSISVRVVDEIPATRRGKRPLVAFV